MRGRVHGGGVRRLGCQVVGVDPSAVSIGTVRWHAEVAVSGPSTTRWGSVRVCPSDGRGFELAYPCDVLEYVADLGPVIERDRPVLTPCGLDLFETINLIRRARCSASRSCRSPVDRGGRDVVTPGEMFIHAHRARGDPRRYGRRLGGDHGRAAVEQAGSAGASSRPTAGASPSAELSRRLDVGWIREYDHVVPGPRHEESRTAERISGDRNPAGGPGWESRRRFREPCFRVGSIRLTMIVASLVGLLSSAMDQDHLTGATGPEPRAVVWDWLKDAVTRRPRRLLSKPKTITDRVTEQ